MVADRAKKNANKHRNDLTSVDEPSKKQITASNLLTMHSHRGQWERGILLTKGGLKATSQKHSNLFINYAKTMHSHRGQWERENKKQ